MQYGTIAGVEKPVARVVQGLAGLSTQNTDFWFPIMDAVVELGGNGVHGGVFRRGRGVRRRW